MAADTASTSGAPPQNELHRMLVMGLGRLDSHFGDSPRYELAFGEQRAPADDGASGSCSQPTQQQQGAAAAASKAPARQAPSGSTGLAPISPSKIIKCMKRLAGSDGALSPLSKNAPTASRQKVKEVKATPVTDAPASSPNYSLPAATETHRLESKQLPAADRTDAQVTSSHVKQRSQSPSKNHSAPSTDAKKQPAPKFDDVESRRRKDKEREEKARRRRERKEKKSEKEGRERGVSEAPPTENADDRLQSGRLAPPMDKSLRVRLSPQLIIERVSPVPPLLSPIAPLPPPGDKKRPRDAQEDTGAAAAATVDGGKETPTCPEQVMVKCHIMANLLSGSTLAAVRQLRQPPPAAQLEAAADAAAVRTESPAPALPKITVRLKAPRDSSKFPISLRPHASSKERSATPAVESQPNTPEVPKSTLHDHSDVDHAAVSIRVDSPFDKRPPVDHADTSAHSGRSQSGQKRSLPSAENVHVERVRDEPGAVENRDEVPTKRPKTARASTSPASASHGSQQTRPGVAGPAPVASKVPVGKVEPFVHNASGSQALGKGIPVQKPATHMVDSDDKLSTHQHYMETMARPTKKKAQSMSDKLWRMLIYVESVVHFVSAARALMRHNAPPHGGVAKGAVHFLKTTHVFLEDVTVRFKNEIAKLQRAAAAAGSGAGGNAATTKDVKQMERVLAVALRLQSVLLWHVYNCRRSDAAQALESMQKMLKCKDAPTRDGTPSASSSTTSTAAPSSTSDAPPAGHGGNSVNTPSPASTNSDPHVLPVDRHDRHHLDRLRGQLELLTPLMHAEDRWHDAAALVQRGEHREFFSHLDKLCGCAHMDSSLYDASVYAMTAVQWVSSSVGGSKSSGSGCRS